MNVGQYRLACIDHRRAVQATLASGVVLQMDQAASADQDIFGYERERGQDTNLDRGLHLCADRYHQETAASAK